MVKNNKQDLVSTNDLCEYYNVTRTTVERWRRKGLPYKVIGTRTIRFDIEEIENWMQENKFKKDMNNERTASM